MGAAADAGCFPTALTEVADQVKALKVEWEKVDAHSYMGFNLIPCRYSGNPHHRQGSRAGSRNADQSLFDAA